MLYVHTSSCSTLILEFCTGPAPCPYSQIRPELTESD